MSTGDKHTIQAGDKDKLNQVAGYAGALLASNKEIAQVLVELIPGGLLYNRDTQELRIVTGTGDNLGTSDHRHPFTHAPLFHSHIFGMNESWCVGNPRLWLRDDLINHPELVPLDGKEIPADAAVKLSEVYHGTVLITDPLTELNGSSYTNGKVSLQASSFKSLYTPKCLFNEPIDLSNFAQIADQWLCDKSDNISLTIHLEGDYDYRPVTYWMIPAAGTSSSLLAKRPTPNSWKVYGSQDGSTWEEIGEETDITDWRPCQIKEFSIDTTKSFFYFKFEFTSWNPGESEDLEPGLRRLYIFGRRTDMFSLPDVPSPHPDFVWVIPYRDLNTAMLNEDIGDIGTTGILPQLLPPYRLETDGTPKSQQDYPELFAVIGWKYDLRAYIDFEIQFDDETDTYEFMPSDPYMLGTFSFSNYQGMGSERVYPLHFTLEASLDGDEWVTLETFHPATPQEFYCVSPGVQEDDYAMYRIKVHEWSGDSPSKAGSITFEAGFHIKGTFHVPYIQKDNITSYIVAYKTPHDVGADILQSLQRNMLDLAHAQANLTQQVQDLLPTIDKE